MKAMMLTGLRSLELREAPPPELAAPTDILLKLAVVGVCGSDIHYYTTGKIGSQVVSYPFVVGHECAGIVERVGPAVRRLKPGDRVAVEPAISCGQCDQCRGGRPHTCRALKFLGCPGQAPGCLAEYLVMPEQCCYPLLPALTLEQAALLEPLAIGFYSVRRGGSIKGARIAILGAGPIGLSVLVCARARGAQTIYVSDRIEARVAVARNAGADWAGNPDQVDIVKEISAREPLLLDQVFECCGQQAALDQAIDLLKPGGKLVMVGIPEVERVSFIIDRARRKELDVLNVRRQCECTAPALALLERGVLKADFMITHRFPFDRTKEAFDLVADYRDGVVKALINFLGTTRNH
ncbi:MAG: alcohol dehydrogenase catalytic domain-containing protein [Lentisphaerae bacterium]|nr:alcohol dehydrogenase catalytic domain-containing protein [Lentisphaerota bacterium]